MKKKSILGNASTKDSKSELADLWNCNKLLCDVMKKKKKIHFR